MTSTTSPTLFTPQPNRVPPTAMITPNSNHNDTEPRPKNIASDLRAHPLIKRLSSGEEETTPLLKPTSSMRRSKTELVLMNRTSSFSRIVFELNDDLKKSTHASSSHPTQHTTEDPLKQSKLFFTRLGILLSRSSGRDKFAQFLQYGSLFWGNQTLIPTSQDADAPWRKLEDSMSSGRKLLRLFKWIKEFERAHRSFWVGDDLSVMAHASWGRSMVARILATFMHTFSFAYYLFDNILYCSQIGLINRPMFLDRATLRLQLRAQYPAPDIPALSALQNQHRLDQQTRAVVRQREVYLKNWRNYSSLARLLLCCVYCTLQLNTISNERKRVEQDLDNLREEASSLESGYDTETSNMGAAGATTVLVTADGLTSKELKAKLQMLADVKKDNIDEIYSSLCNLVILLNRLEFNVFKHTPLWGVGLCGVIAAVIGLEKNWPSLKEEKSSSGGKKKTKKKTDDNGGNDGQ